MTTKATTVIRTIDLPLDTVRQVIESDEFLYTLDDGGAGNTTLTAGERELREDGTVHTTVTATTGKGEDAVVLVQRVELSAPDEDGTFTLFTSVPLPRDLGTMATNQIFRDEDGATTLETTVAAEVNVPVVGQRIVEQLLSGAEDSTDRCVARIVRLAS